MVRNEDLRRMEQIKKEAGLGTEKTKEIEGVDNIINELDRILVKGGFLEEIKFTKLGQVINTAELSSLPNEDFDMVSLLLKKLRKEVESGSVIPDEYLLEQSQTGDKGAGRDLNKVRYDKQTGEPVCPECGRLFNPRCGNCFHNRYKNENPLI